MSVYSKLLAVQSELKVPKTQFNKFGNYNFRNCEDIQEAVKPKLKEVGATLTVGDELIEIGNRFYVKSMAIFTDIEDNTAVINTAYAREEEVIKGMSTAQITGSTSSYARKYALSGLFLLDDTKDADSDDSLTSKKYSIPKSVDSINTELEVVRKECLKAIVEQIKATNRDSVIAKIKSVSPNEENVNNISDANLIKKIKDTVSQ